MKTVDVENFVNKMLSQIDQEPQGPFSAGFMEGIKECCRQLIKNSIEDFNDK